MFEVGTVYDEFGDGDLVGEVDLPFVRANNGDDTLFQLGELRLPDVVQSRATGEHMDDIFVLHRASFAQWGLLMVESVLGRLQHVGACQYSAFRNPFLHLSNRRV